MSMPVTLSHVAAGWPWWWEKASTEGLMAKLRPQQTSPGVYPTKNTAHKGGYSLENNCNNTKKPDGLFIFSKVAENDLQWHTTGVS